MVCGFFEVRLKFEHLVCIWDFSRIIFVCSLIIGKSADENKMARDWFLLGLCLGFSDLIYLIKLFPACQALYLSLNMTSSFIPAKPKVNLYMHRPASTASLARGLTP